MVQYRKRQLAVLAKKRVWTTSPYVAELMLREWFPLHDAETDVDVEEAEAEYRQTLEQFHSQSGFLCMHLAMVIGKGCNNQIFETRLSVGHPLDSRLTTRKSRVASQGPVHNPALNHSCRWHKTKRTI